MRPLLGKVSTQNLNFSQILNHNLLTWIKKKKKRDFIGIQKSESIPKLP